MGFVSVSGDICRPAEYTSTAEGGNEVEGSPGISVIVHRLSSLLVMNGAAGKVVLLHTDLWPMVAIATFINVFRCGMDFL